MPELPVLLPALALISCRLRCTATRQPQECRRLQDRLVEVPLVLVGEVAFHAGITHLLRGGTDSLPVPASMACSSSDLALLVPLEYVEDGELTAAWAAAALGALSPIELAFSLFMGLELGQSLHGKPHPAHDGALLRDHAPHPDELRDDIP